MRVLVTGFERFGSNRVNPTERLARRVDGTLIGAAEISGRVLPTEYAASVRALRRAVREVKPQVVLMFGLAPKRDTLCLEALALNVDHAEEPDNAKVRRWRRPIVQGGPAVLESTLPLDRICRVLRRSRLAVSLSHHAGTYVCNHAYYHALREAPARMRVGFVHVPPGQGAARLLRVVRVMTRVVGGR